MPPQDLLIMYVIKPKERVTFGEGNGNPLQYSCLGNPMDRGAWWATVHGVSESDTAEQLTQQPNNRNVLAGLLKKSFKGEIGFNK